MKKNQGFEKAGEKRVGAYAGHGAFLDVNETYTGDSVNKHQDLEFANEVIGREEIKQQNDNL
ncbi:MAG: hypothetical protein ACQEUT_09775 [Bacillota bacterium]